MYLPFRFAYTVIEILSLSSYIFLTGIDFGEERIWHNYVEPIMKLLITPNPNTYWLDGLYRHIRFVRIIGHVGRAAKKKVRVKDEWGGVDHNLAPHNLSSILY